MTRAEHLEWAKNRALEYADRGKYAEAVASMASDLDKHPETAGHSGSQIGLMMLLSGQLSSPQAMREFINGFH